MRFIDEQRQGSGSSRSAACSQSTVGRSRRAPTEPSRRRPRPGTPRRTADPRSAGHRGQLRRFGARKVWLTLNREGIAVARCTVERLMREPGLREYPRQAGGPPSRTSGDPPGRSGATYFTADAPIGCGSRLHLRANVDRHRLRRLRHRRLRKARFAAVETMATEGLPVQTGCRVVGVSDAGYDVWRKRMPSVRSVRHALAD